MWLRQMLLIRRFEERVKYLFLEGIMPGTIHQCMGQEACAVGVCAALEPDDILTPTHRGHGQCLAKGLTVREMMAELLGRTTGCCKAKGGSLHMGNLDRGVLPAVAIVGASIPIATGVALAFKLKKEKRVVACVMGDGAANEGAFHEGVNMGAIWNLPVLYVVENNLYGASTPVGMVMKTETIAERMGNLKAVYLTGEIARGSDFSIIDLVFVGDINKNYLVNLIEKTEALIQRKIRYIAYSENEFKTENNSDQNNYVLIWNTGNNPL